MGILAETIGHKIMILLGFGAGVASLGILIWSNSFQLIQFQEVLSGMYFAAYILFSAYSFNVTKSQDYQKIISFIRGSYLIGTVASALLGQLLIRYEVPLVVLFYISFGTNLAAIVVGVFLPHVETPKITIENLKVIASDLYAGYSCLCILQYSIWATTLLAIHHLAFLYYQSLFAAIDPTMNWNGLVAAIAYVLATLSSLLPVLIEEKLSKHMFFFQCLVPSLCCLFLILMGLIPNLYLGYGMFILYHATYEMAYPTITAQIGKLLKNEIQMERFSLLFSVNGFFANLIQVLLQFIIGKHALQLLVSEYFLLFGYFVGILGFCYSLFGIANHFLSLTDKDLNVQR